MFPWLRDIVSLARDLYSSFSLIAVLRNEMLIFHNETKNFSTLMKRHCVYFCYDSSFHRFLFICAIEFSGNRN